MSHYIIHNPLHPYAVEIMKRIHKRFGYTPICLFPNAKRRFQNERKFPDIAKLAPDTRFNITRAKLSSIAEELKARHGQISSIVPFGEYAVKQAPDLIELFGCDWNSSAVISRFSDLATSVH